MGLLGEAGGEELAAECEGAVSCNCELGEVCARGELAGCGYVADGDACADAGRGQAQGFEADGGGTEDDDYALGYGAVTAFCRGKSDADGRYDEVAADESGGDRGGPAFDGRTYAGAGWECGGVGGGVEGSGQELSGAVQSWRNARACGQDICGVRVCRPSRV